MILTSITLWLDKILHQLVNSGNYETLGQVTGQQERGVNHLPTGAGFRDSIYHDYP